MATKRSFSCLDCLKNSDLGRKSFLALCFWYARVVLKWLFMWLITDDLDVVFLKCLNDFRANVPWRIWRLDQLGSEVGTSVREDLKKHSSFRSTRISVSSGIAQKMRQLKTDCCYSHSWHTVETSGLQSEVQDSPLGCSKKIFIIYKQNLIFELILFHLYLILFNLYFV